MDPRTKEVITCLQKNAGARDLPITVSAENGNKMVVTGIRRLCARRIAGLCMTHGKSFSIRYDTVPTETPALQLYDTTQWDSPVAPAVSSSELATVVLWASKAGLDVNAEMQDTKRSGSVLCVSVTATGTVTSKDVQNLLALSSVVNIFFSGNSFDVYFSRKTGLLGGLNHIGLTRGHGSKFRGKKIAGKNSNRRRARPRRRRPKPQRS